MHRVRQHEGGGGRGRGGGIRLVLVLFLPSGNPQNELQGRLFYNFPERAKHIMEAENKDELKASYDRGVEVYHVLARRIF